MLRSQYYSIQQFKKKDILALRQNHQNTVICGSQILTKFDLMLKSRYKDARNL